MACRSGNPRSIQLALELGANISTTDGQGNKSLHALVVGNRDEKHDTGPNLRLLIMNGASPDEKSQMGQTALHLAARTAHIKAMEALMHMGLDPNFQKCRRKLTTGCVAALKSLCPLLDEEIQYCLLHF